MQVYKRTLHGRRWCAIDGVKPTGPLWVLARICADLYRQSERMGSSANSCGRLPWGVLFQPTIAAAEEGFPLPQACYNYLIHSGDIVFGQDLSLIHI